MPNQDGRTLNGCFPSRPESALCDWFMAWNSHACRYSDVNFTDKTYLARFGFLQSGRLEAQSDDTHWLRQAGGLFDQKPRKTTVVG
jgi:hypothetical protein